MVNMDACGREGRMNPTNDVSADEWPESWFVAQDRCLFCRSDELSRVIDGVQDWVFRAVPGEFAFSLCRECGSLLLGQRPSNEHIGKAYAVYYTHAEKRTPFPPGSLREKAWLRITHAYSNTRFGKSPSVSDSAIAALVLRIPGIAKRLDVYFRYLPEKPSSVLDYGCGNGDFLLRAHSAGHDAVGIDFDQKAIDLVRQRGLRAHHIDELDDAELTGRFDFITANHVIEHVPDPLALLAQLGSWLKPNGTLFIELPNAKAGGIARNGRFWRGFEAPRHFALPSYESLHAALIAAGFSQVKRIARSEVAAGLDKVGQSLCAQHPSVGHGEPQAGEFTEDEFITLLARK